LENLVIADKDRNSSVIVITISFFIEQRPDIQTYFMAIKASIYAPKMADKM
jgi:hypothetical protein